jgi:hypothetical protein
VRLGALALARRHRLVQPLLVGLFFGLGFSF